MARVPSAEMVRLTSSGTEAAMTAVRLARAATGRDRVVKFAGAYHGHVDGLLAEAGSGLATQAFPACPALPRRRPRTRWSCPGTTATGVERAAAAATLPRCSCEPCPPTWASSRPEPGFLGCLREVSAAAGALLVFDEVITGFRVAPGGAQQREGVTPDLTVLGKVIGGGLPAAATPGRAT